jgi:hypothetical protein
MTSRTLICLALCFAATLGTASAQAQLNCADLIAGDYQRPTKGQFGYARLGTAQGSDERCEGRVMEPHAADFTVDKYMVERDWTRLQSADRIHVRARGLPDGHRGRVTLLGHGSTGPYRLDIFTIGTEPSVWPPGSIAKHLALDWPGLKVVGRVVNAGGGPTVFFPVDLRRSDDSTSEGALMLHLRYGARSPRIRAFIGEYDPPGECRAGALLHEWAPYPRQDEMKISLPPLTGSRFCIAFEVRAEKDNKTHPPITVYFAK